MSLGFITFNSLPFFYLSISLTAGYYAIKSARSILPNFAKGPLGSDPTTERVKRAVKEIISGHFSPLNFLMGTDKKKDRIYSFLAGSFLSFSALTLAMMSYYFFLKCFDPISIDHTKWSACKKINTDYQSNYKQANAQLDHWKKNLCDVEQDQWTHQVPKIKTCFQISSLIPKVTIFDCEDEFNKMTQKSLLKDYNLRDALEINHEHLRHQLNEVSHTCQEWLEEISKKVNEKCSYLHPFLRLDADKMCGLLNYAPFHVSEDCLEVCNESYQKDSQTLRKIESQKIPQTMGQTINCTKSLAKEIPFFTNRSRLDQTITSGIDPGFKEFTRSKARTEMATYSYNWNNMTLLNQDFLSKKYKDLDKKYFLEYVTNSFKLNRYQVDLTPSDLKYASVRRNVIRDLEAKFQFLEDEGSLNLENALIERAKTMVVT
ncbi:MAG: hypothetical protein S4CHLAM7_12450 [Chlamydiae bacterium]|nr:hypothetical protein [Chlamydiota bacterium]